MFDALQRWQAPGISREELCGILIAHPRFAEATRRLHRGKVATAAGDPVMAGLFRDAGHYVVAMLAFSLDRDRGITLPGLQAVSAEAGLMSPGRVRALLGYLQHVGYVARISHRQGREAAVYAPTAGFVMAWCGHMRSGLDAAAVVEPAAAELLARTMDPKVALAFARTQGEVMLEALRGLNGAPTHDLPFVRVFTHRLGGGRVLSHLLGGERDDGPFLDAPVACSADDLSQRTGISRVQVRRLLDEAQDENLMRIENGQMRWMDATKPFILFSTAFEFATLLTAAAITARAGC